MEINNFLLTTFEVADVTKVESCVFFFGFG